MKIQNYAIIFVLIILPLSVVLSNYIQMQLDVANLQGQYKTKLIDSTYDAMMAYELNASAADVATGQSRKQNVLACINTFFTTLATNMGISGTNKKDLYSYIPAILFTSYDGYYIYSPIKTQKIETYGSDDNKAGQAVLDNAGNVKVSTDEQEYNYLVKPFIYYSARYNGDNGDDIVINYSLDNYIAVYGKIGDKKVTKTGYLMDPARIEINGNFKVKLFNITNTYGDPEKPYAYFTKKSIPDGYGYLPFSNSEVYDIINTEGYITNNRFSQPLAKDGGKEYSSMYNCVMDYDTTNENNIIKQTLDWENENKDVSIHVSVDGVEIEDSSAKEYYIKAYYFTTWVNNNLGNLKYQNEFSDESEVADGLNLYNKLNGNTNFLSINGSNNPENPQSAFNQHKRAVIQNSVQYNLNSAISTYSEYYTGTYDFKLPVISDDTWDRMLSNISMTVFLQGVPCGTKYFNDYAVVTSTENKEYIDMNNLYFLSKNQLDDKSSAYHKIDCPYLALTGGDTDYVADVSAEFEYDADQQKTVDESTGEIGNTIEFDHKNVGCYYCIMGDNYEPCVEFDENGIMTDSGCNGDFESRKKAWLTYIAKARQEVYRTNSYINR